MIALGTVLNLDFTSVVHTIKTQEGLVMVEYYR